MIEEDNKKKEELKALQEEVKNMGIQIATMLETRELTKEQRGKVAEMEGRLEYRRMKLQEEIQMRDAQLKIDVMNVILEHISTAPYKGSGIQLPK